MWFHLRSYLLYESMNDRSYADKYMIMYFLALCDDYEMTYERKARVILNLIESL
jgi:hypothetical protein